MKRSNEAFWWSLFAAGGVLAALFVPVLVVMTGFVLPSAANLDEFCLTHRALLPYRPLAPVATQTAPDAVRRIVQRSGSAGAIQVGPGLVWRVTRRMNVRKMLHNRSWRAVPGRMRPAI